MKNIYLMQMESELQKLSQTSQGRRALILASPLLLAACATGTNSRYREGDNRGQDSNLSVAQEQQLTAEVLPKMRQDYPQIQSAGMQRYINSIGQRVVQSSGLHNNPYSYTFTAVDTPSVNAFALPAGTVFVTAPLIAMADSEAELAGVIGHEIGHIQARHTAERMAVQQKSKNKTLLYSLGGGAIGGLLGLGIGKLACRKQDKECLKRAAKYGALAGVGGGLLIQKYGFMANSREDEMEADRIGFRTAHKAGYHKDHIGRFYHKLLIMEQKSSRGGNKLMSGLADAMSTHPPSQERVNQMKQMAAETQGSGAISSEQFKKYRAFAKNVAARSQARAQKGS